MIIENEIIPANNDMINYACKNYHYSMTVPAGRKLAFAIFEENIFTGVIIYSLGASPNISKSFGLKQGEIIELTRVALKTHKNPVSYYLSRTLDKIKNISPSVKMIVSYADIDHQNHVGKIYQATNWIYLGISETHNKDYYFNGRWAHNRTINSYNEEKRKELKRSLESRASSDKHKYIFCIDKNLKKKYMKLSKEYPKDNNSINT
jgi:ABC-type Fe3+-citrate transport system substrate-binding protein